MGKGKKNVVFEYAAVIFAAAFQAGLMWCIEKKQIKKDVNEYLENNYGKHLEEKENQ